MMTNENDHKIDMQNEIPKSFNFIGINSAMTKNGNVITAHDEMKIVNENDTSGIQL